MHSRSICLVSLVRIGPRINRSITHTNIMENLVDQKLQIDNPSHGYKLPDHWVLHELNQDHQFTLLHGAYVHRVIEIIKKSGAQTVLEVGCGDGWNCGEMVKAGLDVVGIDWSINGIAYATALVQGAKFMRADVTSPEFISKFPDKFDAVALVEVIEHIPPNDCVTAIRNIVAPLKKGGTFVLTTPSENFPNNNPLHYQHFTEQKLRNMMQEAGGLRVISVEGYGDVKEGAKHWRRMRWADNRIYSIKPLQKHLAGRYRKTQLTETPLSRSHGIVVTAIRI
jgi:2-polyprenyl-3-methyl-5-hydroxy-6-metoxy-1,4-benzoquinol methylase